MICILDACAAIELVLGRPKMSAIAEVVREAERVLAPTLYTYEVSNVLLALSLMRTHFPGNML